MNEQRDNIPDNRVVSAAHELVTDAGGEVQTERRSRDGTLPGDASFSREEAFARTRSLIGDSAMHELGQASVAVFGLGGVGACAVEALARSGIGQLCLIDPDVYTISNLNRQLPATLDTLGQPKVDAVKQRIARINPECRVETHRVFYGPDTAPDTVLDASLDYVIDAIDDLPGKIELAVRCQRLGIPLISCLGAGNKLDPGQLEVADLYETAVDPLARALRRELRRQGVGRLKVVYSREVPKIRCHPPASAIFVPAAAGLLLASVVLRDLLAALDHAIIDSPAKNKHRYRRCT